MMKTHHQFFSTEKTVDTTIDAFKKNQLVLHTKKKKIGSAIKILLNPSIFIILMIFLSSSIKAQQGPFNWTQPIQVESNSVFLLWMENAGYASAHSYQKVYEYKVGAAFLPPDSMISMTPKQEDSRLGGGPYTDAATGNFTVSPRDHVVSIWGGNMPDNTSWINIMIPHFDTTEAMWSNSIQDSIGGDIQNDRMYVRTVDIDGDDLDEFIVAYLDDQDSIYFNLYDVDSTMQTTLITSFSDEKVIDDFSYQFVRYCIETGDFNGDGKDELALIWVDSPLSSVLFDVKIKIYEFGENLLLPKGEDEFLIPYNNPLQEFLMAVTSGDFKTDSKKELAVTTVRQGGGYWKSYNFMFEISPDLQTITQSDIYLDLLPSVEGFYQHLSMASGDLDNNGLDEIVFSTKKSIYILSTNDDLELTLESEFDVTSGGTYDIQQMYNFLQVSDVNQDGNEDVIIVKNFEQNNQQPDGFYIGMYSIDTSYMEVLIAEFSGDEPENTESRPFSIAVGNFKGKNFIIGEPTHYVQTDIVQPIVILNAPPVHFDMFDGDIYDVNNCYNGGDCDFTANYKKVDTYSIEVQTEVHKDWVVSAGLAYSGSITVEPLGVGVSANIETHLLYTHGSHFSNSTTDITTITIGQEIQASEDDRIYSTVVDYDIWEYPVFHGNESFPRSTILTVVPNDVQSTWYPSKSYSALSYVPDHEVSNILSYQAYDTLDQNPNFAQTIQADYVSDSYVLDANSNDDWYITIDEFNTNQADTVRENGVDTRLMFPYGFVFEGNFNNKKMVTHKTSVSNLIELHVHLGGIDMGLGDVKYTVTPYSYWGTNDALIVDYAAKPELSPPGFPETWWQQKYGTNSDPTFILPWRLDPEKGFAISEPAIRQQTKDIIFSPAIPQLGDTVTITTRVRNFSLIPTPTSVSVSFYVGDPDDGGTPIIGINGTNTVNTPGVIPAQGRAEVELKWIVPADLPDFPRIYAVLDEEDLISEIHPDNNKGFNVLGATFGITTEVQENPVMHTGYSLSQSYPNPFRSTTNIMYSIPNNEKTVIKVFDFMGREIATLINKYQPAGTYVVPFNGSNLASGVYYYSIQSGNYYESRKMILMK